LVSHVTVRGGTQIGERNLIAQGAVIGGDPQDRKFSGEPTYLKIGNDNRIREYVTIHRATHEGHDTTVGRHCLIMGSSHVAHDCVLGDHIILINYAGLTGHITVEDRVTVGGLTGVHPFSKIGTYAYIGGCSKVTQDVPPFMMVDGAPAVARAVNLVGMRRGGLDAASRLKMKAAFRLLYRAGIAPGSAIKDVRRELGGHPLVDRLVEFVESSKRGVVPGPDRAGRRPAAALEEEMS
jgi:UDP-N-acetylglucosamine acyltransferase